MIDHKSGTFDVAFEPSQPGDYLLHLVGNGKDYAIPFPVHVPKGTPNPNLTPISNRTNHTRILTLTLSVTLTRIGTLTLTLRLTLNLSLNLPPNHSSHPHLSLPFPSPSLTLTLTLTLTLR